MKVVSNSGAEVAPLTPGMDNRREEVRKAIEQMHALRASLSKAGITVEDILEMRHRNHRS